MGKDLSIGLVFPLVLFSSVSFADCMKVDYNAIGRSPIQSCERLKNESLLPIQFAQDKAVCKDENQEKTLAGPRPADIACCIGSIGWELVGGCEEEKAFCIDNYEPMTAGDYSGFCGPRGMGTCTQNLGGQEFISILNPPAIGHPRLIVAEKKNRSESIELIQGSGRTTVSIPEVKTECDLGPIWLRDNQAQVDKCVVKSLSPSHQAPVLLSCGYFNPKLEKCCSSYKFQWVQVNRGCAECPPPPPDPLKDSDGQVINSNWSN